MDEEPQDKTKVRIYTDQLIIDGEIAMFEGIRLTDYIINAHDFIAITNACVLTLDDKALFRTDFLNIKKDKIVVIIPEAAIRPA